MIEIFATMDADTTARWSFGVSVFAIVVSLVGAAGTFWQARVAHRAETRVRKEREPLIERSALIPFNSWDGWNAFDITITNRYSVVAAIEKIAFTDQTLKILDLSSATKNVNVNDNKILETPPLCNYELKIGKRLDRAGSEPKRLGRYIRYGGLR